MSVEEITKASKIFKEEFGKGYSPMVQRIWGELAKDSIEAVTNKMEELPANNPDFQIERLLKMQEIEAVLGIFIQRVYDSGRRDAGLAIANKVKTHIMATIF